MSKKHNPGSKKPGAKRRRSAKPSTKQATAAPDQDTVIEGVAEDVERKKKSVDPITFLMQVRSEAEKVTWTSRNETLVSTLMVLVMVVIMAIFFLLVDQGLRLLVGALLSLGS